MFVRNWMRSPAVEVRPDIPARAALDFMGKKRIRRLPVVDAGRLVGIVTKSDLDGVVGKAREAGGREETFVRDVMTRDPVVVAPDETLEKAVGLMIEHKVSGLPVVDDTRLVGIITESDAFLALAELLGVAEKGARVAFEVDEDADLLGAVRRRLSGLALRSLATWHNAGSRRWEVVMRVRGRVPAR
jgi:acetoin utilization protein AcuB